MAGARAAASLSLTIGVAFVTILVMGGILAGPAILDCSHQPQSFGVCLRDHLDHSRLLPVVNEPSQVPVLSSETPAPPVVAPVPEPPSRVADTGHPDGWLDARANEYEPPGTSELAPPPPPPPLPDLVTPPSPLPVPIETGGPAVAEIEILPPPPPLPDLLTPPVPLPRPIDTSSSAVAEIEVLPPPPPHQRPVTTVVKPKAEVKKPVTKPARVAKAVPKAPPRPKPPRTFKNDPRFPNVTVLQAPARGSNSSFVALETH